MANDRIYVECLVCKHTHSILTYWGAGEFHDVPYNTREGKRETFAAWATRHAQECHNYFGNDLDRFAGFRLLTEHGEAAPRPVHVCRHTVRVWRCPRLPRQTRRARRRRVTRRR